MQDKHFYILQIPLLKLEGFVRESNIFSDYKEHTKAQICH